MVLKFILLDATLNVLYLRFFLVKRTEIRTNLTHNKIIIMARQTNLVNIKLVSNWVLYFAKFYVKIFSF